MPFVNSESFASFLHLGCLLSLSLALIFFFFFWSDHCSYCFQCVISHFSCLWLCDHMDHSPPGSSVHGIFLGKILEWVAMISSRGSSQPRHQIHISCIASGFFTAESWGKPNTMLNQSDNGWHTCLVDLTGNASSFSLSSKLAVSLPYMAFVMLTCFLYS